MSEQLIRYDAMIAAIDACHRVDELKDYHDKALALQIYARQALNEDAEHKAAEVRLRAEKRVGQLLKEQAANGQRSNGRNLPNDMESHAATPTLKDIGITKTQSSRWQALAEIPEEQFEKHLADQTKIPSTAGILADMKAVNGATKMDDDSLWLWGTLCDFEKNRLLARDARDVFGGMTNTMQADVRRIVPMLNQWISQLLE